MSGTAYFLWLAEQGWSGVMYFPRVSVAIWVLPLLAFVVLRPFRRPDAGRIGVWSAVPFGIPVLLLLVGTVLHSVGGPTTAFQGPRSGLGILLITGLLVSQLGFAGLFSRRFRDLSAYVSALTVAQLWISLWFAFAALVSVTGEGP